MLESQGLSGKDRVIRVFISSTFRDMMRERDLLVKEVFSELRRKCAKRFVTFTEVDLRWGITEAQANEGQVLPLCLAEIERSRPYFIGLLGERYGWIPDTIRPEVIEREPWLKEHVQGRTSVTELEILHGVLNNPKMQSHAFFYFRDSAYVNDAALTDDERRDMVERDIRADVEKYGPAEATRRTEERKAKLAALKQRIRDSKLPLAQPYPNPRTLARVVRRQFNRLIDRLYPEDQVPDLLEQERIAHEAHAKNKLFACIDRPAHLAALNAFATVGRVPSRGDSAAAADAPGEGAGPSSVLPSHPLDSLAPSEGERGRMRGPAKAVQGLVVTGESGGGKTALLAAWALFWTKKHPADFLFQHYFGATPDSALPEGFLRRLLGELKSRFGITDDIPTDPEKLRDALLVWLAQASTTLSRPAGHPLPSDGVGGEGQSRIVLVLDGLDQVQGSEPDRRLRFLPRHFPPQVVALASALPGPALDALHERGWAEHDLPRASESVVDAMVGEYLKIHARTLEPELRHQLVTAPGAKNPLFLRTVLEELRQCGSFEQLPQRVRHYLEADNPKDLFLRVLTRWQEDFDGKDPQQDKLKLDLVRRALTHLWAARQGLSEPEWLDLLGMSSPTSAPSSINHQPSTINSSPLPRALWTPLFLALESHLSQRAGLFTFGHDFLRQAVGTAFVPSGDLQQTAHLSVANYFERLPARPRRTVELPWQWLKAKCWLKLYELLIDWEFFLALWDADQFDARNYWTQLEKGSPYRMRDGYQPVLKNVAVHAPDTWRLAELLKSRGYLREAAQVYLDEIEHYEQANDLKRLAATLTSLGLVLEIQGELETALEAFGRAECVCRTIDNEVSRALLAETLSAQAIVMEQKGNYDRALTLHQQAEHICRQFKVAQGVAGVANAIEGQARVQIAKGGFQIALKLLRENETLCRNAGQLEGLQRCFGDQAVVLLRLGQHSEALAAIEAKEQLCESLGFLSGVAYAVGTEGTIQENQGDYGHALAAYTRSANIFRQIGEPAGLAIALYNQCRLIGRCGGTSAEAKRLLNEAILIATTHGLTSALAQMDRDCLDNQRPTRRGLSKSWLAIRIMCVGIHWLFGIALATSFFPWPGPTIASALGWKAAQILVAAYLIVEGAAYKRTAAIRQPPEAFRFAGFCFQALGVGLASYVGFRVFVGGASNDCSSVAVRLMILFLWYLPVLAASLWASHVRRNNATEKPNQQDHEIVHLCTQESAQRKYSK